MARKAGIEASRISFAGPGKRDSELAQAVAAHVLINAESEGELLRLAALAQHQGRVARVALRVNPAFELKGAGMRMGGGPRPFGIDEEMIPGLMTGWSRFGQHLAFEGLHIFAGSQNLSGEAIAEAQRASYQLALRLAAHAPAPIKTLNLGGGFGIPYFPHEAPLDLTPIIAALNEIATDAAQRLHGLSTNDLFIALYRQRGWPGVVRARTIAGLSSSRRETPLESWSAWAFHDCAVAQPLWQIEILTPAGTFVGRVDCWWPAGVAGESDGRIKSLLAMAEQAGADTTALADLIAAERHREQGIRRLGADVVRWEAGDVRSSSRALELAGHLNRTLSRRRTFTGRTQPAHAPQVTPSPGQTGPRGVIRGA